MSYQLDYQLIPRAICTSPTTNVYWHQSDSQIPVFSLNLLLASLDHSWHKVVPETDAETLWNLRELINTCEKKGEEAELG